MMSCLCSFSLELFLHSDSYGINNLRHFLPLSILLGDGYSRVVFAPAGGETLWNLPAIKSMCDVDNSRVCKYS